MSLVATVNSLLMFVGMYPRALRPFVGRLQNGYNLCRSPLLKKNITVEPLRSASGGIFYLLPGKFTSST